MAIAELPRISIPCAVSCRERVPGAKIFVFGHVADGNLHIAVCAGDAQRHAATFDEVERCVYEPLRSITGSISAEHGIGLREKGRILKSRARAPRLRPCVS